MEAATSSGALERGKACLRCRRRKMKCDGAHPVCGQCARANRGVDCEYSEGQGLTASQLLERQVAELEARIIELESTRSAPLTLHDPYEAFHRSQGARSQTSQQRNRTLHELMRAFFRQTSETGFFLHITRFLQKVSAVNLSDHPVHINVLLNTIYLWGAQLSGNPQYLAQQPSFLAKVLERLPTALAEANTSGSAILYVLQTEVLLSLYFLTNNSTLEGIYHTRAAASIVLTCKFHRIRGSRTSRSAPVTAYRLNPPADVIEEGERINAFWTTFILDKCWNAIVGGTSAFTEDESRETVVDCPWPMDLAEYESKPFPVNFRSEKTVQAFLQNPTASSGAQSMLGLQAKAAILFASASEIAPRWNPNSASTRGRFVQADNAIQAFKQTIPVIARIDPSRLDVIRNLLGIQGLVECAGMGLYKATEQPDIRLNGRTWTAATNAVVTLQVANISAMTYVNPTTITAWKMVADVLIQGLTTARRSGVMDASNEAALLSPLSQIVSALGRWGILSPLARQQRTAIERAIASL